MDGYGCGYGYYLNLPSYNDICAKEETNCIKPEQPNINEQSGLSQEAAYMLIKLIRFFNSNDFKLKPAVEKGY